MRWSKNFGIDSPDASGFYAAIRREGMPVNICSYLEWRTEFDELTKNRQMFADALHALSREIDPKKFASLLSGPVEKSGLSTEKWGYSSAEKHYFDGSILSAEAINRTLNDPSHTKEKWTLSLDVLLESVDKLVSQLKDLSTSHTKNLIFSDMYTMAKSIQASDLLKQFRQKLSANPVLSSDDTRGNLIIEAQNNNPPVSKIGVEILSLCLDSKEYAQLKTLWARCEVLSSFALHQLQMENIHYIETPMVDFTGTGIEVLDAVNPNRSNELVDNYSPMMDELRSFLGKNRLDKAEIALARVRRETPITMSLSPDKPIMLLTGNNGGGKTQAENTLVGTLENALLTGANPTARVVRLTPTLYDVHALINTFTHSDSRSAYQNESLRLMTALEALVAKEATQAGILVMDEIGKGTDSRDAVALTLAVAAYCKHHNIYLVLASHYGEELLEAARVIGLADSIKICAPDPNTHAIHELTTPAQSRGVEVMEQRARGQIPPRILHTLCENATLIRTAVAHGSKLKADSLKQHETHNWRRGEMPYITPAALRSMSMGDEDGGNVLDYLAKLVKTYNIYTVRAQFERRCREKDQPWGKKARLHTDAIIQNAETPGLQGTLDGINAIASMLQAEPGIINAQRIALHSKHRKQLFDRGFDHKLDSSVTGPLNVLARASSNEMIEAIASLEVTLPTVSSTHPEVKRIIKYGRTILTLKDTVNRVQEQVLLQVESDLVKILSSDILRYLGNQGLERLIANDTTLGSDVTTLKSSLEIGDKLVLGKILGRLLRTHEEMTWTDPCKRLAERLGIKGFARYIIETQNMDDVLKKLVKGDFTWLQTIFYGPHSYNDMVRFVKDVHLLAQEKWANQLPESSLENIYETLGIEFDATIDTVRDQLKLLPDSDTKIKFLKIFQDKDSRSLYDRGQAVRYGQEAAFDLTMLQAVKKNGFVKAMESDSGKLKIRDSIALTLLAGYDVSTAKVIPQSLQIDEGIDVIVLGGQNGGGKTQFLVQMAAGCVWANAIGYAPAAEANIPNFQFVHCMVNAGASEKNKSSFQNEIDRIINLISLYIDSGSPKSGIIFVDEPLAGTSSPDQIGIWVSLLHFFKQQGVKVVFTNHNHKLYPYMQSAGIQSQILAFGDTDESGRFTPTITTAENAGNVRSNGIAAARKMGVPQNIIEVAQYVRTVTSATV